MRIEYKIPNSKSKKKNKKKEEKTSIVLKFKIIPNKTAKEYIDKTLCTLKSFYNKTLYELMVNHKNAKEWIKDGEVQRDKKTNEPLYYADINKMKSAAWRDEMLKIIPELADVPSSAYYNNNGIFSKNMQMSLSTSPTFWEVAQRKKEEKEK